MCIAVMANMRIKHDVVIITIVAALILCIVGLALTGIDTDNLCTSPRNSCLYRPIGLGVGSSFSRIIAYNEGLARPGDRIAITAGIPLGTPGATNMLRIAFVRQDGAGSS